MGKVIEPSDSESEEIHLTFAEINKLSNEELWQHIGFHRPIGGFFYKLPFYFITLILGIAVVGWLTQYLYPFPEALGYRSVAISIFALMIEAFNLGTANMMNRFIGEMNVKNPKKMVHYLQYFIWYQMITGLIQTTMISFYALFFAPEMELGYAVWILLVFSLTEYPGMLNVFRSALATLQQYDKTTILDFLSGELFQRLTEIGFVLLGRYYGIQNPEIGEILGIAIGATIGFYIDDFVSMAVAGYYFNKIIKQYGFDIKETFRHDFDVELFKECLFWGIKSGLPSLIWGVVTYVELILWLRFVPQYATFKALHDIAGTFSGLMGWNIELGGAISESFMNDKKDLARYYIQQSWRYTGLIQYLMISVILIVTMILEPVFVMLNIEYQILAIPFILPRVIRDIQQPYNNITMNVISSTGHVNFQAITNLVETALSLISWIIVIPVLHLPDKFGINAVVWMLPCTELPAIMTKIILQNIYIQKKVLKQRIPLYQTFVAPAVAAIIYTLCGYLFVTVVFFPLQSAYGTLIALIPSALLLLIVGTFLIYFPLTALMGGWDDGSIAILETASKISGGGRFFAVPFYKIIKFFASKSKLHNKFGVDETKPLDEVKELMTIKNENLENNE